MLFRILNFPKSSKDLVKTWRKLESNTKEWHFVNLPLRQRAILSTCKELSGGKQTSLPEYNFLGWDSCEPFSTSSEPGCLQSFSK